MKIALVNGLDTIWLAGNPALSERIHSSAAGLVFSGEINLQPQPRLRAKSMIFRDRGNLSAGVSFSTARRFPTLAEAEVFAATYDILYPRAGVLDFYGADGSVVSRLAGAVVNPPRRTVNGVSVEMEYSAVGGQWLVPDGQGAYTPPAITMGGSPITMG